MSAAGGPREGNLFDAVDVDEGDDDARDVVRREESYEPGDYERRRGPWGQLGARREAWNRDRLGTL